MSDPSQSSQQRQFPCPSCGSIIFIPFSLPATTAPCPHCQATITSPPPPSDQPAPASEARQPQPDNTTGPTAIPERRNPPAQPRETHPDDSGETHEGSAPPEPKTKGILVALLGILFLIIASGVAVFLIADKMGKTTPPSETVASDDDGEIGESNYLRFGWQQDATDTLAKFLAGTSVEEKLPFVHKPGILRQTMEDFYGGAVIDDADTPAESFAVWELSEHDRSRGIFLMIYNQPPQLSIKKFFRPLASLEVQHGLEEPGLLLRSVARSDNFSMEPVTVYAFFKKTEDGLKLDWEVFAQTKYRTFSNFIEFPDPLAKEIFRVVIAEDVPEDGQGTSATRTYRITDPAHTGDSARIDVGIDTELGRTLSTLNWRGTKQAAPSPRTATVELEWIESAGGPELRIGRFICWEFLGLGGEELTTAALAE